jgi:hypothetical protein
MSTPRYTETVTQNADIQNGDGRRHSRGLSGFRLKIIGSVLVLIGIISSSVFQYDIGAQGNGLSMNAIFFSLVFEIISWLAYPIYAFLLVEGMKHSAHIGRYFVQLLVLAIISEIPFDLTHSWRAFDWQNQNPVFGLVICALILWLFKRLAGQKDFLSWLMRVLAVVIGVGCVEVFRIDNMSAPNNYYFLYGGILMLGYCVIFYALASRSSMMVVATIWSVAGIIFPAFGLIPLRHYNHELGYSKPWVKWVFYLIYPVMLLLFSLGKM